MPNDLLEICQEAQKLGQYMDLTGCCYGEHTRTGRFFDKPSAYYYFLAGFVRFLGLSSILEFGTHYGGSIKAMNKGIDEELLSKSILVTIDQEQKNEDGFKLFPRIKRICGNDIEKGTVDRVVALFDRDVDLIFVDAGHSYEHYEALCEIYIPQLNPKYVIFDDVFLNDSMRRFWKELKEECGDKVLDITGLSGRGSKVGLGILQLN